MINILNQMKNQTDLSNNEKIVRDYILANPELVIEQDVKTLSKKCYVSVSTIYRLCNKLKLDGFAELKLKIASSLKEYHNTDDEFDYNFPIKQFQTHHNILVKLKEDYEQTIINTYNYFDLEELRKIVIALKKAKYIDLYTSAGNIYFALNFMFQMSEIGVHVHVPIEEYHQRLTAAQSSKEHLAIIISFEGRGLLNETIIETLKQTNTPILLISSYTYKIYKDDIQYHLYISPYENHYNKISSFSTRLSILYILDVLYTCYFKEDYDNNLEKKLLFYKKMG